MIQAILFDLDGTLVQSEKLKAESYAIAAQRLQGLAHPDERAVEAYREIVGATREAASLHVMNRLVLKPLLKPLMEEYSAPTPEAVLAAMRGAIYLEVVADPAVLRANQWPHTVGLLRVAKETFCKTGLATMSYRTEALHVLDALDIRQHLDVVLTREDIETPKPAPEIYLKAASRLGVEPGECLVLEDSPIGVRAGLAAGMQVIAIATPFTACGLEEAQLVPERWVVREPETLPSIVRACIAAHNRGS